MVSYQAFITIFSLSCVSKQNSELKKLKIKQTWLEVNWLDIMKERTMNKKVFIRRLPTIKFRELNS